MATGSLYQLYWLWVTGQELAASRGKGSVDKLLWPLLLFCSTALMLWVSVAQVAGWTRGMSILVGVMIASWLAADVSRATQRLQQQAQVEQQRWYYIRPGATTVLLLIGIAIGCAGVQPGDPTLTGGTPSGAERIFDVWASGLLLPMWLLYVQHGLNEALRRMHPVSDEEQLFGADGTHSAVQVATIRKRLAVHHAKRQRSENLDIVPWVTASLAAICTAVFVWQVMSFGFALSFNDMRSSGVASMKFVEQGEWWRLITQHFVHFSVDHWAFNMFALIMGGWMLERSLGHRAMALVIVLSMVGATAVSWYGNYALFGMEAYEVISGGESGIGFGVIGALVASDAAAATPGGKFGRWMMILGGISSLAPGVAVFAHAGGFLGGAAAVWIVTWRTARQRAQASEADLEQARPLDGIQVSDVVAPAAVHADELPRIPAPPRTLPPWQR